jgi:hypothetical protein
LLRMSGNSQIWSTERIPRYSTEIARYGYEGTPSP